LPLMNIAEFEDLLDRLGEDMSTWPAPLQQAAAVLLRSSDEARGLLEETRLMRRALAGTPIRAPAGLADRIMLGVRQPASEPAAAPLRALSSGNGALVSLKSPRPLTLPFAACFLAGILVGISPSFLPDEPSRIDFPSFLAHVMDISRATD
jgi:hypothetical protein